MGRRRLVGYGKSATAPARCVIWVASRRIRRRLPSRRDLFVSRASSLGLAATFLHRRASCTIGSLCEISRKGVGGLEKHSSRELGSIGAGHCFALETICVPADVADYDELRLARHPGYVPDVSGAVLGFRSDSAFDGNRYFNDRSDYRRNPVWAAV